MLKLYLVYCVQSKRHEKVREFFDRLSGELQGQSEWREWFALLFLSSPETNPAFASFFSRQWQDTLLLSLFNFLSLIFACLPPPRLADYASTTWKLRRLREENDALKQRLLSIDAALRQKNLTLADITCPDTVPCEDLMDDFFIIAQEAPSTESQTKTLKDFLRNITGGTSTSSANQSVNEKKATRSAQVTSCLRQPNSRSSSKTRTSGSSALTPQQQQHAPVKRVAKSVSSSSPVPRNLSSPSLSTGSVEKLAFLLLGQEEYQEHRSEVTHCRFTSSGSAIASGDVDGIIKVWTAAPTQKTLATFISQGGISSLEWLPNSEKHFLYGSKNGIIRLCDKDERKATGEMSFSDQTVVYTLSCSPSANCFVASVGTPDTARGTSPSSSSLLLCDMRTMSREHDFAIAGAPLPPLTSCAFNHNSQMVIAAGTDSKVRIFDLRKKDCLSSWSVDSERPIASLALSADETEVYTLTNDGRFSAWSLYQRGQKSVDHQLDDSYFSSCRRSAFGRVFSLSGDGKHILMCSNNGGIIYELGASGLDKVLGLKGHREHTTCVDWSAASDCGPCITAGRDGQVRVSTLLSQ